MLQAVIPISDREKARNNLERCEILLKSLNFFWNDEERFLIYLIVPDGEKTAISIYIESLRNSLPKLEVSVLTESSISSVLGSISPNFGVMKQMLVKLSCFDIVSSDYAILFDSDVVACKPFGAADLIKEGRALTEWLRPSLSEWWMESARVLGYSLTNSDFAVPRMFVTPQILCRPIVTALLSKVAENLDTDWMIGLISEYSGTHPNIWTEYTLYDLFSDRNNMRLSYHIGPEEIVGNHLHCMEQSIWGAANFPTWSPKAALDGTSSGYFMVLQSITAGSVSFDEVKARWIEAAVATYSDYTV
jgi:hypothetical protein